jgi:hypothetical protein
MLRDTYILYVAFSGDGIVHAYDDPLTSHSPSTLRDIHRSPPEYAVLSPQPYRYSRRRSRRLHHDTERGFISTDREAHSQQHTGRSLQRSLSTRYAHGCYDTYHSIGLPAADELIRLITQRRIADTAASAH